MTNPQDLDLEGVSDPMAATVLPNLLRVGLVPKRLLNGYLAQGFCIDPAAKTVRDVHSFGAEAQESREAYRDAGLDFADPLQAAQLA